MPEYVIGSQTLVYLATFAYALGFLFRDQVILRLLVLIGTALYIAYYYLHLDEPQWGAIIGSCIIGGATLVGFLNLLYSRLPIGIIGMNRRIYDSFGTLEPGEFRALMRCGKMIQASSSVALTIENQHPDSLYFVIEGSPLIEKDQREFRIPNNCFIGEVAFLRNQPASATVTLPEGGVIVRWERRRLQKLLVRSPRLQQAFEAMIGRDMADKVAQSVRVKKLSLVPPANPRRPVPEEQKIIAALS